LKYKSSNDAIGLDDKEEAKIIGKGYFDMSYYSTSAKIRHTIKITTKIGVLNI
jgi:hypothetical protein